MNYDLVQSNNKKIGQMNSLCDFCKFKKSCSLTSTKKVIYDCSEHEKNMIFTDVSQSMILNNLYYEPKSSAGLCKNCDFEKSCTFNQIGTAVFNCEQYQ